MNISLHLLVAVALVATLLVIVLAEATLRRRVRRFRALQLFVIASGLFFVPANIVSSLTDEGNAWHMAAVVGGLAAVIAQVIIVMLAWVPVDKVDRPRRVLAIGAHPDDLELAASPAAPATSSSSPMPTACSAPPPSPGCSRASVTARWGRSVAMTSPSTSPPRSPRCWL